LLRLLQRHHQQTQEMVAQRLFEQQHGCHLRVMLASQTCREGLREIERQRQRVGGGRGSEDMYGGREGGREAGR
jgi:hypothetical protein